MPSTFAARIDRLVEHVVGGNLTGRVEVDQVYAQFQHEGLDLKHPRGGQAKYLEQPLFDNHRDYLQRIADAVLDVDRPLSAPMIAAMEALSGEVFKLAPVEFFDLRASGHPTVEHAGATTYDRPPTQPRLTTDQLRAKSRLRSLGDGGFGNGLGSLYGF